MRNSSYFIVLFFSLIITACSSYNVHEPKRPAIKVERPEISFNLRKTAEGALELSLSNNGKEAFRYYDGFTPHGRGYPSFVTFRLCNRAPAECGGTEWINPNLMVSSFIVLPAELSELEAGGSITTTIVTQSMVAMGGAHEPKSGDYLQIRVPVMLTENLDEYIEYVSEWMPMETFMWQ